MNGILFGISAIHTEMKEGILVSQKDYASKPLRDRLKRGSTMNGSCNNFSIRFLRGCAKSESGVSTCVGERVESTEIANNVGSI